MYSFYTIFKQTIFLCSAQKKQKYISQCQLWYSSTASWAYNWTFGDTFLCVNAKGKVHLVLVQEMQLTKEVIKPLTILDYDLLHLWRNLSGLIKMQSLKKKKKEFPMIFPVLFPAPSKIGCTFPAWMQSKKSWSSIDSAFVWKFSGGSTGGNSTWRNNTKLATSENNFVNHEESQVWCHKIQELLVEENDSDRRRRRNHQKIILYATSGW